MSKLDTRYVEASQFKGIFGSLILSFPPLITIDTTQLANASWMLGISRRTRSTSIRFRFFDPKNTKHTITLIARNQKFNPIAMSNDTIRATLANATMKSFTGFDNNKKHLEHNVNDQLKLIDILTKKTADQETIIERYQNSVVEAESINDSDAEELKEYREGRRVVVTDSNEDIVLERLRKNTETRLSRLKTKMVNVAPEEKPTTLIKSVA